MMRGAMWGDWCAWFPGMSSFGLCVTVVVLKFAPHKKLYFACNKR